MPLRFEVPQRQLGKLLVVLPDDSLMGPVGAPLLIVYWSIGLLFVVAVVVSK